LAIDAVFGDPPNSVHPLRWIGNLVGWLDRRISRKNPRTTKIKGFLTYVLIASLTISLSLLVLVLARMHIGEHWGFDLGTAVWIILTALLFKFTFAVFSFRKHCRPIQKDLRNGDLVGAAGKTQMIVSRRTEGMDPEHLASCCVETTAETFADSVCSPGLYFGLFGIFGAFMFRSANLMDAMWGYRNEKYGDLGFFPAKFDDVLGFITSRMSVLFIALAALLMRLDARSAVRTAMNEHGKTPSPNSGWPMAAVAGALGVTMEKKNVHVIGSGPLPSVDDIGRGYRLVELSSVLMMLMVTIPLYVFVGIHVQVFLEDRLYDILEMIF
jgi:adenosylcobinamide-phosphate synthase